MIRVYIATTQGPVEVQRITREDPEVRSVVCLNGTAKALPISRDYDSFVKDPTGVIQRAYGHPAFRMDVAAPITDGQSWQLGAFIAHALFNEDLLATPEDNVEEVIWLSGELDRDLNVRPVDHIKEKLTASRPLFDSLRAQNIRTFCFIPGGAGLVPDDDFLEDLQVDGDLLRLEAVAMVKRIINRFDLKDPSPDEMEEEEDNQDDEEEIIDLYKPEEGAPPPAKDNKALKLVAIIACVAALGIGLYLQFEDNIIALRAGSIRLGISELRANANEGCTKTDRIVLERNDNSFPSSELDGLCAIEITINNIGAPAYLWAFAQRLNDGHYLLADRESLLEPEMQKGLIGWRMILPKKMPKSIDYRVVALAAGHPLGDAVERMLRRSFGDGQADWDKIQEQLIEEKITVVTAVHSLVK